MSLNLATILRQGAADHPGRSALICGDTEHSYGAIHGMAQRFAGALLGRLGLRPGQHLALMLPNVPAFSVAYFGGHYAALPIVPLNVLFTADEIAYHLDDSDAVALVVWHDLLPQAQAAVARVPSCKHLIVVRGGEGDDFMALVNEGVPVTDLPPTMPDDTAVLLYTSGTTGRPKGAELTHFNLYYNAEFAVARMLQPLAPPVSFCALPLFHSFGQTVVHNGTLFCGGTVVLVPRFTPQGAIEVMQRHQVSLFAGVPTMYFALLHHRGRRRGCCLPCDTASAGGRRCRWR